MITIEGNTTAVPSLHHKSISPVPPSSQHDELDETTSDNVTVTIHADHIDVSHEPDQSITSEPESETTKEQKESTTTSTDSVDDLSGLISTEQPLNLDAAIETRHVADTQATDQQTDTTVQDSDVHTTTHTDTNGGSTAADHTDDHETGQTADEHKTGKTDTNDSDTVAAGDVLNDQGNDNNIDDLLASQPEKAPIAAPKTETESVASSTNTQHDTEPAPVADTSTLDSNLVDTPEDQ